MARDCEDDHTLECGICGHQLRMAFAELIAVEEWANGRKWEPICGNHLEPAEPSPDATGAHRI